MHSSQARVTAIRTSPRAIEADCVRRVPETHHVGSVLAAQAEADLPSDPLLAPSVQPPPAPAAPETIPRREPPPRIEPLSPQRVRFSFTGSADLLRKVDRAKELLWHKHPDGRLEDIIEEILKVFLDKKDPNRRLARKAAKEKRNLTP